MDAMSVGFQGIYDSIVNVAPNVFLMVVFIGTVFLSNVFKGAYDNRRFYKIIEKFLPDVAKEKIKERDAIINEQEEKLVELQDENNRLKAMCRLSISSAKAMNEELKEKE